MKIINLTKAKELIYQLNYVSSDTGYGSLYRGPYVLFEDGSLFLGLIYDLFNKS